MKENSLSKKILSLLLAVLVVLSGFVISNTERAVTTLASSDLIWSAPATQKIRKDVDYTLDERGDAKINVLMCKNESEGAHLILSPSKSVDSYDIVITDLSDGKGNVIPKSDIEVFNQHYMRTFTQSNKYHEPGWYPDAIIPFENAKAKGENKIIAGDNQGIYVKFETHEETVAGDYSGNFTVTIDGTNYTVPVNVHVYDFAVPEGEFPINFGTLWINYLTQGDYDSGIDMWTKYYEYFLDHGMSVFDIPIEGTDVDGWLNRLEKYYDKMSAYNLPYGLGFTWEPAGRLWRYGPDYDELEMLIKKIVKFSVEKGKDYVSKAYIDNFHTDEYDQTAAFGEDRIISAKYFADRMFFIFGNVIKYFDITYGEQYIDSVPGLRESIGDIGVISVSGSWVDGVADKFNTMCPSLPSFFRFRTAYGDDWVERFISDPSNRMTSVWWYTTISCDYPDRPGYQIDDPAVDERIMSWMEYYYGVEGHLYWATNLYTDTREYGLSPGDEWTVANRCGGGKWNGDGYLVYPGYDYGIEGPIGTIRLENIRDGGEEYKWLNILEEEYANLREYYGVDVNTNALMQSAYNSLFNEAAPNYDLDNFAYQRNMVAESILSTRSDEKIAFLSYEEDLNYYYTSVVIDSKYTITADDIVGTELTENGKGRIYTFKISKNKAGSIYLTLNYSSDSNSGVFQKYLGEGSVEVLSFADIAHAENIAISTKSGSSIVGVKEIDGVTALNMNLTTYKGLQALTKYAYFEFTTEYILSVMNNPKSIFIDIYNGSEYALNLVVYATSAKVDNIVATTSLAAKGWTRVAITNTLGLANAKTLRFALPNSVTTFEFTTEVEIPIDMHDIYISRLAYSNK